MHAAFIWRGKRYAEQQRPPTVLGLGARGVALRGLRGGYCERRAHRYGLVQLGVLVVHLERGRLARSGRQECESYAGGCKAAVGQEVASMTGACERGPVGDVAWRWVEAHTLVIEVVLKSSSESLISLPKTRCWVVRG